MRSFASLQMREGDGSAESGRAHMICQTQEEDAQHDERRESRRRNARNSSVVFDQQRRAPAPEGISSVVVERREREFRL